MEAGVSGDYTAIMRFINGLERSQTFFIVRAMNLSGQQSGAVNLRLQVSTWLRPADAAASGLPIEGDPSTTRPADGSGGTDNGDAMNRVLWNPTLASKDVARMGHPASAMGPPVSAAVGEGQ
jgi:hypothetical protein